jgi:predicted DCC family thiol-disulfide oxidoreductase YuxK
VNTEITDKNGDSVLYDAHCSFCSRWAQRLEPLLRRRGFQLRPLPEPSGEMRVQTRDGNVVGGADAVVYLARRIWWAWPLVALSKLPGGLALLRRAYRWVASNRYCLHRWCEQTEDI